MANAELLKRIKELVKFDQIKFNKHAQKDLEKPGRNIPYKLIKKMFLSGVILTNEELYIKSPKRSEERIYVLYKHFTKYLIVSFYHFKNIIIVYHIGPQTAEEKRVFLNARKNINRFKGFYLYKYLFLLWRIDLKMMPLSY